MVLMYFLRALEELGLYYAFAGTVAGARGASMTMAVLLVQSGCFALSALLRNRRWARLAALLPAAVLLFFAGGPDRIMSLPGLAYLVCLAWLGDYHLRWARQADVFSLMWKLFLPFIPLAALFGAFEGLAGQGLPVFLTAAVSSVLLLRSIRHGPEIYCRRAYQMRNWLAVAAMLAGACLASMDWFLGCISWTYDNVAVPLLLGMAMAVGLVLTAVMPLIYQLLANLFWEGDIDVAFPAGEAGPLDLARELAGESGNLGGRVLTALGILAAALAVFLLFRWLLRRRPGPEAEAISWGERRTVAAEPPRREVLPATYAGRIRAQYRRFLKLCRKKGVDLSPSDTSAQVSAKAGRWLADPEVLSALEAIYCRARYDNQATREDLAEVKRLCGQVRKARD